MMQLIKPCWLEISLVAVTFISFSCSFMSSSHVEGVRIMSHETESQNRTLVMQKEVNNSVLDKVAENMNGGETAKGTRWAILIAGSAGYYNYRHQADVCHAYQLLRQGGLQEENIVVFMYDDIANNMANPLPGKIINNPDGVDVYKGVPKDYTGNDLTVNNLFAVLMGNKSALSGGSGKVVNSGPADHIFIYYSDHGGPGILGMPNPPYLYADEFIETLKKKYESSSYNKMVIYVEACESGSIFDGLLPQGMNIYVTTASNPDESSWATYCPGMVPSSPPGFDVCLGDLYSVSWMEDSEIHNLLRETLQDQYVTVKSRTSNQNTYEFGSHVMQYGDIAMKKDRLSFYMGFNPALTNAYQLHDNKTPASSQFLYTNWTKSNGHTSLGFEIFVAGKLSSGVLQRDADLLHMWHKYVSAPEASMRKAEAWGEVMKVMAGRTQIDATVDLVGKLLFGSQVGSHAVLTALRPAGQPLVDDWQCLKTTVRVFEAKCGALTQYGMKHMRAFANICNAGKSTYQVEAAVEEACTSTTSSPFMSHLAILQASPEGHLIA